MSHGPSAPLYWHWKKSRRHRAETFCPSIMNPSGAPSAPYNRGARGVPQLDTPRSNRGYRRSQRDGGPQAAPLGRPLRDRMCSPGYRAHEFRKSA